MDRNTITVMTGQVVDFFDTDFREMYAVSEQVDLYKEFNITKPPMPVPVRKPAEQPQLRPVPTSRFQVSIGDSRQGDLKVPAHKYHNPKYSLVVGNSLGRTCSLQDLSIQKDSSGNGLNQRNGLQKKLPLANGGSNEKLDRVCPQSPTSPVVEEDEEEGKKPQVVSGKKQRSSFRLFLKGRGTNQTTEATVEGTVTPQNPSPTRKVSETNSVETDELEDTFEIIEKPSIMKFMNKKPAKLAQRSMSLQTINTGDDDDGMC